MDSIPLNRKEQSPMENRNRRIHVIVSGILVGLPVLYALIWTIILLNEPNGWDNFQSPFQVMIGCCVASITLSVAYLIIDSNRIHDREPRIELSRHIRWLSAIQSIGVFGMFYFGYHFTGAENLWSFLLEILS
jgi:hypothetical protein